MPADITTELPQGSESEFTLDQLPPEVIENILAQMVNRRNPEETRREMSSLAQTNTKLNDIYKGTSPPAVFYDEINKFHNLVNELWNKRPWNHGTIDEKSSVEISDSDVLAFSATAGYLPDPLIESLVNHVVKLSAYPKNEKGQYIYSIYPKGSKFYNIYNRRH